MQATGAAQEHTFEEVAGRRDGMRSRSRCSCSAPAFLALGILVGLVSPFGVMIGLVGGVLSFTGLVLGAQLVMPPALRLVGRVLGRSAAGRLAAENAVRYPERSSRTTIGLVIGVTLITMFAVAMASWEHMIRVAQDANPELFQGIDEMMLVTTAVFSVLVGFSALIAAVGMVNNLSLSVLQRTRELGLLRALGFTAGQLRQMVLAEAAQLTVAAIAVGLVLGVGYGWAGAQSMLGSMNGIPGPGRAGGARMAHRRGGGGWRAADGRGIHRPDASCDADRARGGARRRLTRVVKHGAAPRRRPCDGGTLIPCSPAFSFLVAAASPSI